MRSLAALSAVVIGGLSFNAWACEQPPIVIIPAQDEDIVGNEEAILEDTREYFQSMQEFVACIQAELSSAGEEAPELYKRVLVTRNNLAVAEAEAVQQWFNSRFEAPAGVELPPAAE